MNEVMEKVIVKEEIFNMVNFFWLIVIISYGSIVCVFNINLNNDRDNVI